MPENNLLQADVPRGATIIPQTRGTAPGLICPLGQKVIYAVPGVPYEMSDMFDRAILPDLLERQRQAGETAVIKSTVLRTWGASESALAEAVGERFDELAVGGKVTIAFLASGIEGIKVRLTAKGTDDADATALLASEERIVSALIEEKLGDIIFSATTNRWRRSWRRCSSAQGSTLAVAESLTGGLIASRLVNVAGASTWFRGGVVQLRLASEVRSARVPEGPVVSAEAAEAMALGVRKLLNSEVGLSVTGVAGPDEQDDQPAGTVFVGLSLGREHDARRRCDFPVTAPACVVTPPSARSTFFVERCKRLVSRSLPLRFHKRG